MAEQIITLGIGGTPANLTPFVLSGLDVSAEVFIIVSLTLRDRPNTLTLEDRPDDLNLRDRPNTLTLEDI